MLSRRSSGSVLPGDDTKTVDNPPFKNSPLHARSGKLKPENNSDYNFDLHFSSWTLSIRDKNLEKEYTAFLVKEHLSFITVIFVLPIYFVYFAVSLESMLNPPETSTFLVALRHAKSLSILPVGAYMYCIAEARCTCLWRHPFNITHLGNFIILLHAILSGLVLWQRSSLKSCEESNDDGELWCNPAAEYHSIPVGSFIFGAVTTMAIPVLVKCHLWVVVELSLFCFIVALISSLVVVAAPANTFYESAIFGVCILLALYDHERYKLRAFIMNVSLEAATATNMTAEAEKRVFRKMSTQLRNVIGNISHDLKTPIQAIRFEVDGVKSNFAASNNFFIDTDAVNILRQSCQAMETVIHKALDYMQVSAGLQLVPKIQRVDIRACYALLGDGIPTKANVEISIEPLPAFVKLSPFLLMDRRWFLENAWCLTSNAVKYTANGSVKLKLLVRTSTDLWNDIKSDLDAVTLFHRSNGSREVSRGHGTFESSYPDTKSDSSPSTSLSDQFVIRARETNPDYLLYFEVEDTGVGIAIEGRAAIFGERSPPSSDPNTSGGIGRGLFSLSERIQCVKGYCGVRSRRDGERGSLLWFAIPYHPILTSVTQPLSGKENMRIVKRKATEITKNIVTEERVFDLELRDIESGDNCSSPYQKPGPGFSRSVDYAVTEEPKSKHVPGHGAPEKLGPISLTLPMSAPVTCRHHDNGTTGQSLTFPIFKTNGDALHVLVVDDALLIQKTAKRALEKEGYVVDVAGDGQACLEKIKESDGKYSVILMDFNMPIMGGLEAAIELRKIEKETGHRHIVIGFSANMENAKQSAVDAGMDDFLSKPLSTRDFKHTLASLMEWQSIS